MKLKQKRQKLFLVIMFVLLTALMVGPVSAGGWAEITMDELPGEIHAGETVQMSFMVRQHGETPVHFLGDSDIAVKPIISGTNTKTGQTIEFTAVPDKSEIGRFQAEVTFPTEGEWQWEIAPNPLAGITQFKPLMVMPEIAAPAPEAQTNAETAASTTTPSVAGLPAITPYAGGLLLFAGLGLLAFTRLRRRRQITVAVDSGD